MQRRRAVAGEGASWATVALLVFINVESARAGEGVPGPELPYDVSRVRGIESLPRDERIHALLASNGFVILPREHRQIFGPYLENPAAPYVPPFVTVDSAVRTYQGMLTEGFRRLERAQAPRLAAISARLGTRIRALRFRDAPWREARDRLEAWVAVGLRLQDERADFSGLSEGARTLAAREWELIGRGAAAESVIMGRRDRPFLFGHLTPAGFYEDEPVLADYYRAAKWYGLTSFRVRESAELPSVLLLAACVRGDRELCDLLAGFAAPFDALLGPPDDITLREAADVLDGLPGVPASLDVQALSAALPAFGAGMAALRLPRVNDQVLDPETYLTAADTATQGVRLLPPRHTWEADFVTQMVRQQRCPLPLPLHVVLAMGDRRAAELLRRQGAAEREAIEEIARIGSEAFASSAPALYKDCLQTIGGVFAPLPAGAPAFARTDAWATACTFSALGGWVSIRHQFELHAKDAVFYVGYSLEPPRPSGYVAPYPHVFRKLGALSTKTHDLLERFGVFGVTAQHGKDAEWPSAADVSAGFGQFAKLMDQIAVIAEKQLRGDALMHAERAVLEQYGTTLGRLHFHRGFIWGDAWAEDDMPQAVLFTTSYDDMWSLVESYAATGRAFEVYVIRPAPPERVHDVGTREEVEIPAALQLYRGGVFSFYEWTKFADTPRLTDAKWRQVLDGEAYPESPARLPAWAAEMVFPVEPGHRARASAGLLPAGCEERRFDGVEDPALAEAALQGYLKGGADATGLLRVFLDRGRPEDADQLVALAPRIANPVDLQHVARAFAARASVSSRERLFAAAPQGHLNLLIMAYYAVASGTALENMRTIFGASEEGRWVLAAALGRDLKRSTEMTVDSDAAAAPSPIRPANVRALAALAAEDASFLVRAQAMDALSAAPREEALPVLRRGLADSSSAVRTFAGLSLAALGDTRSYPEIGSVLRGLENPDLRAQVFAEGERMLRAQAYLEDGEQGPRGVEEAYLVMLLLGGLEFVLHEETARVQLADIYARKYVTDPRYWQWGWRCEAADPGFFGDLAIALATDRTGTDRSRADALEGLLYCSSPLSLWHVACLEPLLDDATVADAQTGERFCDMAAGIILRTVEKDGLVSMESEAQRRDAQHRARLALEYATRYSARYSADTRDAREWEESVPVSALDAWNGSGIPQGISPGCVDALVSPWIHHQLGGLVSFEDGALALEYLFLTGLGDLIPAPRSTSLLLQGASWPMSEQTISVGGRRFTIPWLAAGGSGAFYLQPVFRGSVTVECDCTFDFVGEYAPEFTLIVRDGEERHGASFGVRAVRMEDGDAGPRGPKGGSLDRGELPEALISGKPVALRVELRWPDGAEQGALHVFFAGEEVSVLEGVDTAYGRVGLSWSNCYFVIWRLAVAGTLDRGWAVDALYREALRTLDDRDSSQTADDLRVRVLDEVFERPATRPR